MSSSILAKMDFATLQAYWRDTVHSDCETARAIDFELSERLGRELEAEQIINHKAG